METNQANPNSKINCTFMRHAESLGNRHGAEAGKDVSLSDNGRNQAKSMSGYFDCVITSCMKRAKQTLEFSNIKSKAVFTTHLARERMNSDINDYLETESQLEVETIDDLKHRFTQLKALIRKLSETYPHILIISHAMFLCANTGQNGMYNCQSIGYTFDD